MCILQPSVLPMFLVSHNHCLPRVWTPLSLSPTCVLWGDMDIMSSLLSVFLNNDFVRSLLCNEEKLL